jgi:hypothetical protein
MDPTFQTHPHGCGPCYPWISNWISIHCRHWRTRCKGKDVEHSTSSSKSRTDLIVFLVAYPTTSVPKHGPEVVQLHGSIREVDRPSVDGFLCMCDGLREVVYAACPTVSVPKAISEVIQVRDSLEMVGRRSIDGFLCMCNSLLEVVYPASPIMSILKDLLCVP